MKTYWSVYVDGDEQAPAKADGYLAMLCAETTGAEPPNPTQLEAGTKELLRERAIPLPTGIFMPVVAPESDRHEPPDRPGWSGTDLKLWLMD